MNIQMRTICMCFSALQDPRCRIRYLLKGNIFLRPISFARIWSENFLSLSGTLGSNYSIKPLRSNFNRPSRGSLDSGRWKQRPITTKPAPGNHKIQSNRPCTVKPDELLDGVVTASNKLNVNKSEPHEFEGIKYCSVQQKIECKGVQRLVTIFVFDIETTGFSRENERIIDFALRDLCGGENSTFQTLINPDRYVPNPHVHGITTHMVNRPDVPRFKDLIPILRSYVQSRQIPSAPVLWVSHNARSFDVPFLINEFSRCSEEIPSDWLFLDTLPLARELSKLDGAKHLSGKSVQALREYYGIPLVGKAHRAMSDVHSLSMILQEMTVDLKLPVSSLIERAFKASDLMNLKKKSKKKSMS